MKYVNSYIFLERDKEENDLELVKKEECIYIMKETFYDLFKKIFIINENGENCIKKLNKKVETSKKEKIYFYDVFEGSLRVKDKKFKYKITEANSTYYLDIYGNFRNINATVPFFEYFNEKLYYNKDSIILKRYIPILSYDTVSECYCNQIYPLLNTFERKFRKLLFLIYTSQFKKLYFEKTTSQGVRRSVNRILGKCDEDYKIQNCFYSLEFKTMQDLLFEENWTELEEKEKKKLLNNEFSNLSEDELKKIISNIRPRNDWERFFENKGFKSDLKTTMKKITKLRNKVAHNKIFSKEDYQNLKQMLEGNIKIIDDAIKITETEDFFKINMESLNELNKKLFDSLRKVVDNLLISIGVN